MREVLAIVACGLSLLLLACCGEGPEAERAAETEVAQEVDLPLPDTGPLDPASPSEKSLPTEQPPLAFDPLLVKNIDVADPARTEYIESLREEWPEDPSDEWVYEECRRLYKLKGAQPDGYESGLEALNAKLRASESPFTISDIGESTITLLDTESRLTLTVPLPAEPKPGARAPGGDRYPPGYMPPYGGKRK